jgi:hypothetical protein
MYIQIYGSFAECFHSDESVVKKGVSNSVLQRFKFRDSKFSYVLTLRVLMCIITGLYLLNYNFWKELLSLFSLHYLTTSKIVYTYMTFCPNMTAKFAALPHLKNIWDISVTIVSDYRLDDRGSIPVATLQARDL